MTSNITSLSKRANGGNSYRQASHSLWAFSTFIVGETPFPEFSAIVMLDDIQLWYYDSNVEKIIHRRHGSGNAYEEQEYGKNIFADQYHSMKRRALLSSQKLNKTNGVHVQQRMAGCGLLANYGHGMLSMVKFLEFTYGNVYNPICIQILRNNLHTRKNIVMRKVKPRVRLLQKRLPDSGGVRVTCLATGFYSRHINLTLLRDGQPVPDHQISGGELLPNGDETYQMRKSLEVSTEELQQHHYTCTAQHLSLDNKLNIDLGF
ncbi:antigen-presenting glycoprotein CD1d-like [Engraulis encrasicolus]|uniref:antigen-presenting glycoprotein CD1d-like n=1 Tax=Engraulis encrasicolus TaxID=184585 RepID=UPI002FD5A308